MTGKTRRFRNLRRPVLNAVRPALRERSSGRIRRGIGFAVVMAVKALQVLTVACALAALAGCGRVPLDLGASGGASGGTAGQGSAGDGGSGQGGGSAQACNGLDETTCSATPSCQWQTCQVCPGAPAFGGCTTPGGPPVECPGELCITAQPCSSLDQATCKTRSDCGPEYCCGGEVYEGCGAAGAAFTCMTSCPAPPTCDGLDEMACTARTDCVALSCACMGVLNFAGCLAPGEQIGCGPCPVPVPLFTCDTFGETLCKAINGCTPQYCPDCSGGQRFVGCAGPGEGVACGTCPASNPCAAVTTSAECDSRTDCHSVFADLGTCDCVAPGCCIGYSRCVDGGKTACSGPTGAGGLCMRQPPGCGGAYVTSYTADCYEGCVRPTECAYVAPLGL